MSYKRYIIIDGKRYGPYEYSSHRDKDGSVKSVYHGIHNPSPKGNSSKKNSRRNETRKISLWILPLAILFFLTFVFTLLFFINPSFEKTVTGWVVDTLGEPGVPVENLTNETIPEVPINITNETAPIEPEEPTMPVETPPEEPTMPIETPIENLTNETIPIEPTNFSNETLPEIPEVPINITNETLPLSENLTNGTLDILGSGGGGEILMVGGGETSFSYNKLSPGCVLALDFDENTTTQYDRSGYNNNGTVSDATWNLSGRYGGGLEFDGTDDYVNVPHSNSLSMGSGDYSMEAWARFPTGIADNYGDIVGKGGWNGVLTYGIVNGNGAIYGYLANNTWTDRIMSANAYGYDNNTWHHYVLTFDRDANMILYVDGVVIDSTSISSYANTNFNGVDNVHIGEYPGWYTQGSIDHVKIYNRALSAEEVQASYMNHKCGYVNANVLFNETNVWQAHEKENNLYLPLDVSSTSQQDWGRYWKNNASTNSAVFRTDCAGGTNGCYYLDGSTTYLSIAEDPTIDFSYQSGFTAIIWANLTTLSEFAYNTLIAKGTGDNPNFLRWSLGQEGAGNEGSHIRLRETDGALNFYWDSIDTYFDTPTNEWHMYAFTYDGNKLRIITYYDGEIKANDTATTTYMADVGGDEYNVGQQTGGGDGLQAVVDEIYLYNRTLTQEEIKQHYYHTLRILNSTGTCLEINASDIVVNGNNYTIYAEDAATYGIKDNSFSNTTIKNFIMNATQYGVYMTGSNSFVINNQIFNASYGISTSGNSNNLTRNTIRGGAGTTNGIYFNSGGSNKVFENNLSVLSNGVYSTGSDNNIIKNNTITGNGYGIFLMDSDYNLVSYNAIKDNTYGIYFGATAAGTSNNIVINSTITNNNYGIYFYTGIVAKPPYPFITDNFVIDSSITSLVNDTTSKVSSTNNIHNNTLLNATGNSYNVSLDGGGADSAIYVQWYVDVATNYSNSSSGTGATVTGYDKNSVQALTDTVDSTSLITRQNVTEYLAVAAGKTFLSNYTFSAAKDNFLSQTESANISGNKLGVNKIQLTLREIPSITDFVPINDSWGNNTVNMSVKFIGDLGTYNASLYIASDLGETFNFNGSKIISNNTFNVITPKTWLNDDNYRWYINLTNGSYANQTEIRTIHVDSVKPTINFTSPTPNNQSTVDSNRLTINVTVSDDRTSTNMSALIDWNKSLVGWWRFEENNGTSAVDTSTYGNTGTLTSMNTGLDNDTKSGRTYSGYRGKAMKFDGINAGDYITNATNIPILNSFGTGGITVEAWVYVAGTPNAAFPCIVDKSSGDFSNTNLNQKGIFLSVPYLSTPENMKWAIGNGSGYDSVTYTISSTNIQNRWYHVVGIADDQSASTPQLRLYVNGNLVGSTSRTKIGSIDVTSSNLNIGRWSIGRYFNGTIDEVAIFNRALSVDEINASYNAGVYRLQRYFTNLGSGTYSVKAYAVDNAGNLNFTENRTITLNACGCNNGTFNYNCGDTVYESCTMNCNLNTSDTCFTVGADNLVIDGNGYRLLDNNKGGTSSGLYLQYDVNTTVKNFYIINFSNGISLEQAYNNTLENNTFYNNTQGIILTSSAKNKILNSTFVNNTRGIEFATHSSSNLVRYSSLLNDTISIYVYSLGSTPGADLANNTIQDTRLNSTSGSYDFSSAPGGNANANFTLLNTTHDRSKISVTVGDPVTANVVYAKWYVDVAANYSNSSTATGAIVSIYDNSSNLKLTDTVESTSLITRQNITEYYQTSSGKMYLSNYSFNATIGSLKSDTQSANITGNNISVNKIQLTFSAIGISSCMNITTAGSYQLLNNVEAETCFSMDTHNIVLDCDGYSINYSLMVKGYGVNDSSGYDNITVKNCNISQVNSSLSTANNINFLNSNNLMLINNSVYHNGSGYGLYSNGGFNSSFIDNFCWTNYGGASCIYLASSSNSTIEENSVKITGGNGVVGVRISNCENSITNNNSVWAIGTNSNKLVILASSNHSRVLNNNLTLDSGSFYSILTGGMGVTLETVFNVTLRNNTMKLDSGNAINIYEYIYSPTLTAKSNYFNHSIDMSNLADGLPLVYNFSLSNMNLYQNQNVTATYGALICSYCKNVTYDNIIMSKDGISFFNTTDSKITNSKIKTSSGIGVFIATHSDNNNISDNIISTTTYPLFAVHLRENAWNNYLSDNIINTTSTSAYAVYIYQGNGTQLKGNDISTGGTAGHGIFLRNTNYSTIDSNNLTTASSNAITLYLASAFNSTTKNNTISGVEWEYEISSSGNILSLNDTAITTSGAAASALAFYITSSDNIDIRGLYVNQSTSSVAPNYGAFSINGGYNNSLRDSRIYAYQNNYGLKYHSTGKSNLTIIDTNISSSAGAQIFFANEANSGILNLTNVTITNISIGATSLASLNNHYYLDAAVNYTNSTACQGCDVTIYDVNNTLYNVTTGKGGSTSGLVGWWELEEGTGTSASDTSGNGNTGTMQNMESADWIKGKIGKALSFDGINEYINVSNSYTLKTQEFSISMWLYPINSSEVNPISLSENNLNYGWTVYSNAPWTYGNFVVGNGTSYELATDFLKNVFVNNNWTHVILTMNSTKNLKLYINGVYIKQNQFSAPYQTVYYRSNDTFKIGGGRGMSGAHSMFNGTLDEVKIYNRALSESEIMYEYQNGVTKRQTLLEYMQNSTRKYMKTNYTVNATDGTGWSNKTEIVNLTTNNISANKIQLYISAESLLVNSYEPTNDSWGNNTMNMSFKIVGSYGTYNASLYVASNLGTDFKFNGSKIVTDSALDVITPKTWLNDDNYRWYIYVANSSAVNSTEIKTVHVDSIKPGIDFVTPTPANDSKARNYSTIIVNVSVSDDRTSTNMSALIDFNKSLVGWWRFEYSSENVSNAFDESTYKNNGTLMNMNKGLDNNSISGWTYSGYRGKGMKFDGVNDYVSRTNTASLTPDSLTVEGWIKFNNNSNWMMVDLGSAGEIGAYYIYGDSLASGKSMFSIFGSSGTRYNAGFSDAFSVGQWYHLVGTFDNSTGIMNAYVNGVLKGTQAGASLGKNPSDLLIGKYEGGSYQVNGSIDEVKIWNRALNLQEINASYNAGIYRLERNFSNLNPGTYSIKAYAVDNAGNLNSTENRTIRINYPPNAVNYTLPEWRNHTTNRTLQFNWLNTTDRDGDTITLFNLNITCLPAGCIPNDKLFANYTQNFTGDLINQLKNFYDDLEYYNFSVRAWDGYDFGDENISTFFLDSLVSINLMNDTIEFGSMGHGETKNTTSTNPGPFIFYNDGNCYTNVSVNATQLWTSQSSASDYYKYKADYLLNESTSFNWSKSTTTWTQMPINTAALNFLHFLNYSKANNSAEVDLLITVPLGGLGEMSGYRYSNVTFIASYTPEGSTGTG